VLYHGTIHRQNTQVKVAWISYFPVEWLSHIPEPLTRLPRQHPATWQRVLLKEFEQAQGLSLDIIIVRKFFDRDYHFERNGVRFHCLRVPGGWRRPSFFWVDTLLIRRCLHAIQPDLVHAWGTEDGAGLVASRLPYPFVTTLQGLMQWYLRETKPTIHLLLAAVLERFALRRSRTVTAESNFAVEFIRNRYPRLNVQRVEVVPDSRFHHVIRKPHTRPVRFLFVGFLGFPKGGDLLLRALAQCDFDFRLVVVGSADQKLLSSFKPELPKELWGRVEYKQGLDTAQMSDEYSAATMMICPTRVDTGPMVVKEAVVAGLPVIGSRIGGIPDYIIPGKNGILFPSGDLTALVQGIRAAIAHPLLSKGLVDPNALHSKREELSPQRMAQAFLKMYAATSVIQHGQFSNE
jgi:glycosyltransferase involved in cell wall biosynthesis